MKDGLLGLLSALLIAQNVDDISLYEYGSLVLAIDDAVIERMLRNPDVFSIRNTAVSTGPRFEAVQALRARLQMPEDTEGSSFLQLARALFREVRALEPFARNTDVHLTSTAKLFRQAFKEAVEPDVLIFETLPKGLGLPSVPVVGKKGTNLDSVQFANSIVDSLLELKSAYGLLLERCLNGLADSLAIGLSDSSFRERLHGQAVNVLESILQRRLKTFAYALSRETLSDQAWIENIAMVVCDGVPPRMWTDEDEAKFALQIADLGANFRRLQALLYERLAISAEGFESRRITITWPDGREISESVALSGQEMSSINELVGSSLKRLERVFGSDQQARRALAAWLWMNEAKTTASDLHADKEALGV
jgi:hypothetical protein